jgi:hypothetical protein
MPESTPIQRVNVDFTASVLRELNQAAEWNGSRQAMVKTFVRQALDQHHLARGAWKASSHRTCGSRYVERADISATLSRRVLRSP